MRLRSAFSIQNVANILLMMMVGSVQSILLMMIGWIGVKFFF